MAVIRVVIYLGDLCYIASLPSPMPPVDLPTPHIFQSCCDFENIRNEQQHSKFACPHCSKVFRYPTNFHKHVLTHSHRTSFT